MQFGNSVILKKISLVNTKVATRMAAQIGLVEPFEVEGNWDQYSERLEQYLVANNITEEERKRAVFLTVVGPRTYALLSGLIAPEKPAAKTYQELKEVLRKHLKPKPLVIAERFEFHQRCQREGETVATFMAELRKLADRCEFGDYLSQALRDRLVCGLGSEQIRRTLLTVTLEKAYSKAHGMETAAQSEDSKVLTLPNVGKGQELSKGHVGGVGNLDTHRLIVFTSLKSVEHVDKQDTLLGVVNPRRGHTRPM